MRKDYEKRIADLKNNLEGDSKKSREEFERLLREMKEQHEKEIKMVRVEGEREKEQAVKREIEVKEETI